MQRIFYHNILSQMQTFYDAFYTKPKRGRKLLCPKTFFRDIFMT